MMCMRNPSSFKAYKDSILYVIASFVSPIISLLVLGRLSQVVNPDIYGEFTFLISIILILNSVISIQFHSSYYRYYYLEYDSIKLFRGIQKYFLFILLILSIILFPTSYLIRISLIKSLCLLLVLYFNLNEVLYDQHIRVLEKPTLIIRTEIIISFIYNLLLFMSLRVLSVEVFLLIFGLRSILKMTIYEIYFKLPLNGGYSICTVYRIMHKYSLPLTIHSFSNNLLLRVDRIILVSMLGLQSNAIYSIANKFSDILKNSLKAINNYAAPRVYKNENSIPVFFYSEILVIILAIFAFFYFEPLVSKLISIKYLPNSSIVAVLLASQIFRSLIIPLLNSFSNELRSLEIAVISIYTVGLNIVLNFILINRIGIEGAAISTALAYFVQFISLNLVYNEYKFSILGDAKVIRSTIYIIIIVLLIILKL